MLRSENHGGAPVVGVNFFEAVSQVEIVGPHPFDKRVE